MYTACTRNGLKAKHIRSRRVQQITSRSVLLAVASTHQAATTRPRDDLAATAFKNVVLVLQFLSQRSREPLKFEPLLGKDLGNRRNDLVIRDRRIWMPVRSSSLRR